MGSSEFLPPGLAHSALIMSSKVSGKGDTAGALGGFLNTLESSSAEAADLGLHLVVQGGNDLLEQSLEVLSWKESDGCFLGPRRLLPGPFSTLLIRIPAIEPSVDTPSSKSTRFLYTVVTFWPFFLPSGQSSWCGAWGEDFVGPPAHLTLP